MPTRRSRRGERIGIRDVAARAGVSTATVSNSLNSTGRVSEETRSRVVAAATELGYQPMVAARAMTGTRTGVLGLALTTYGMSDVPYTRIPYYSETILGATEAAHARGFLLLVIPGSTEGSTWEAVGIDGVVQSEPVRGDAVRAKLLTRGIPLVSNGRPFDLRPADCWVDNDHASTLIGLLDHLREAGARRIGMLLPRHEDYFAVSMAEAYRLWCRCHRQRTRAESFTVTAALDGERAAARRLLTRSPRADAIVGIYNDSGYSALAAAVACDLAVPDDVLVACVTDDPSYAFSDPPITTVSLQPRVAAAACVDLLVDLVEGAPITEQHRLIPTVLHPRRSTCVIRS